MTLNPLIIGAPFGNYFDQAEATSTLGTFTYERRAGTLKRWWRILLTVRYYPGIGAWKNKLGLPNPGIAWLFGQVSHGKIRVSNKIVSISARTTSDWDWLIACTHLMDPAYVELNVSCPNCPGETDSTDYESIFRKAAKLLPGRVIVKLPPVGYRNIVKMAMVNGVMGFHCCNTLPTPTGGISGKPLKVLSLAAVQEVKKLLGSQKHILIGGGGITSVQDANDYWMAGVTNIAIASVLFFPWKWRLIKELGGRH